MSKVHNILRGASRRAALLAFALCAGIGSAMAADYPVRPVKWIVPYPPAGTTDVLARIIAQWLTEKLGQPLVVENRPGDRKSVV